VLEKVKRYKRNLDKQVKVGLDDLIKMFRYNWMVRNEWLELCKQIPIEELMRKRNGGADSILYTLFHILDVEYSWLRGVQGKPDSPVPFENYQTIEKINDLSEAWNKENQSFLFTWSDEFENDVVTVPWIEGSFFAKGEVLRHVIAHEIHHVGQLSIWIRELGLEPV
jgi:uncharacterized damage-inducible protein DinB